MKVSRAGYVVNCQNGQGRQAALEFHPDLHVAHAVNAARIITERDGFYTTIVGQGCLRTRGEHYDLRSDRGLLRRKHFQHEGSGGVRDWNVDRGAGWNAVRRSANHESSFQSSFKIVGRPAKSWKSTLSSVRNRCAKKRLVATATGKCGFRRAAVAASCGRAYRRPFQIARCRQG